MADYDIPYAYDLYHRLVGQVTVGGQPLGALLLDDTHNLWHCFAQGAASDDCVRFSVTKRFADVAAGYGEALKGGMTIRYFLVGGLAFLVTLVALIQIRLGARRALIYSVDRASGPKGSDFRIGGVYQELEKNTIPYTEVFHTSIGKQFLANLGKRGRPAIYLEGIEWFFYVARSVKRVARGRAAPLVIGGLGDFSVDEKLFVEALVRKYVGVAPLIRFRADFLTAVLKGSRVKVVLAIDDPRHYHEVMIAAHRSGISSYAFQHGANFTPYHVGWLADARLAGTCVRSDYLVLWNEYWKGEARIFNALWPEDALIVAGMPRAAPTLGAARGEGPVLLACETHAPQSVVREVIAELDAAHVPFVMKIRLDLSHAVQLAPLGLAEDDPRAVTDLKTLTTPISSALGTYSTFLYEAAEAGIPVGLIETPLRYAARMLTNGLADPVRPGHVAEDLARVTATDDTEMRRRQDILASGTRFSTVFKDILATSV